MEDFLANLSFLRAWIHKPAFPGLLYSDSCNLRKGLFVYRKVLGIVDPAGGVRFSYGALLRETYLLLVDDATNEVGIGVKSIR